MSAHVRRIAILSTASPDGWRLYPVGAGHGDRVAAVPAEHDGAPPLRPGAPRITSRRREADRRASTGG
jgi:hypothetical protein